MVLGEPIEIIAIYTTTKTKTVYAEYKMFWNVLEVNEQQPMKEYEICLHRFECFRTLNTYTQKYQY